MAARRATGVSAKMMVEPTDEGALERYLHLMSECAKDQDWAVHHPEWMTRLHLLWDDLTLDEKRFVNASDSSQRGAAGGE
ncbi:MAG: hypothetical protein ACJ79L_10720 [Anaeromyxobacteraceae bacterium]